MIRKFLLIMLGPLLGCSEQYLLSSVLEDEIFNALQETKGQSIDFSTLAGDEWGKVCFFGPYNQQSSEALGFEWNVDKHTNALKSDSHNVIVFATESEVIGYTVFARRNGDFSNLSGECIFRESAQLSRSIDSLTWKTLRE
ncbi:hypothetical protein [Methylophaga sp. OBS3]|uniref:hypothetical protein n=1 Tax=Methylophaga sp. OBS3 TaxID=2991934 RepID=UPI00225279A1|nr:hypothetical protein [Methylophaga sp. OBS3]MCX4189011.1 hypothetical protein [Methylophaga sp. OBS3]